MLKALITLCVRDFITLWADYDIMNFYNIWIITLWAVITLLAIITLVATMTNTRPQTAIHLISS